MEGTLKISTEVLKEMVSKSVKGASCRKILPLTQMMSIQVKNGVLTLATTDMVNYLYVKQSGVDCGDFSAVVPVDKFSQLVSKTTSETIGLAVEGPSLKVAGNGSYLIPIQYEEDGSMVKFPEPLSAFKAETTVNLNSSSIQRILTSLKPSLAVTMEEPWYTGYYLGKKAISTDTCLVNILDAELLPEPHLISSATMDLVSLIGTETFVAEFSGNECVFASPNCVVYGRDMEGIESFEVDAILKYLEMDFKSMCKVDRVELLRLLERISLFVGPYDDGGVRFMFTQDGIQISSMSSDGVETIPYMESQGFAEFPCLADVEMITRQVKAQSMDVVEIWYGNDALIKMVDGNLTQLVALLDDNSNEQ